MSSPAAIYRPSSEKVCLEAIYRPMSEKVCPEAIYRPAANPAPPKAGGSQVKAGRLAAASGRPGSPRAEGSQVKAGGRGGPQAASKPGPGGWLPPAAGRAQGSRQVEAGRLLAANGRPSLSLRGGGS